MAGLLALASKPYTMTFRSKPTDFYIIRLRAPLLSVLFVEDSCSDSYFDMTEHRYYAALPYFFRLQE